MNFSDDLRRFSRDVERKAKGVEQSLGRVSLPDLMPPAFVQKHTPFPTLQEMVDAAPGSVDAVTDEESAAYLKGPVWDDFVAENSDFDGWEAMIRAAGEERIRRAIDRAD